MGASGIVTFSKTVILLLLLNCASGHMSSPLIFFRRDHYKVIAVGCFSNLVIHGKNVVQ